MKKIKRFYFETDGDVKIKQLEVSIQEIIDPQYGLFVWPAAPVLAHYLFYHQESIADKHILELGAGTGLPGIVAAKLGGQVTLSDAEVHENCLENCRKNCAENGMHENKIKVIPITWGLVNEELLCLNKVDIILGSDCFYDNKDFEDIIFTVAFIIERNPGAVFLTAYQLRDCNYTIEDLLIRWKLCWREIPLTSFSPGGHHLFGGWDASMKHEIQLFEIRKESNNIGNETDGKSV